LEIDYRQPARLGDLLSVTFGLAERGRSRLIAVQDVLCDELTLVRSRVTLACLDRRTWRPARIPAPLAARINDRVIEETI